METITETYETSVEEYKNLAVNEDNCRWKKGDLALEIEIKYGQKTLQKFAIDVNEEYNTLRVYRKVAGIFIKKERKTNLSWTHHFIASMSSEPFKWLEKAEENNYTTRQLKNAIKRKKEPISETSREITSLSINKKIFEEFKLFCKEKHLIMSYLLEDIMKQIISQWRSGTENKIEISLK